jgi:hypothetical protein
MPNRYGAVQELLDTLKAAGCTKAKLELMAGEVVALDVEFEPSPVSASPFVDARGKPVDLDEGMPALAKDPDAPAPDDDADTGAEIERMNFRKPQQAS